MVLRKISRRAFAKVTVLSYNNMIKAHLNHTNMKIKYLQCRKLSTSGYSRVIMFNGVENPDKAEPKMPDDPSRPEQLRSGTPASPESAAGEAKSRAAKLVANAGQKAEQLVTHEQTYEAQPFSAEELKSKTKGFPEVKPAKPADLIANLKANFQQSRNEPMDHGDVASAFIDPGDGNEMEYILLCDKSGKTPKYRLFKHH
jgi:hypothetical protein